MGYFPFFIDIKDKNCVVIGGGTVALRKVEKLIPFEPRITVVAPKICREITDLENIETVKRSFTESDLDGAFMTICATDNEELNSRIFELCTNRNIPVNTVDDKEKCGFLFPALVHEKDITVGITTSGRSPVYAKFLKEQIDGLLDSFHLKIEELLGRYRPVVKRIFSTEYKRKEAFEAILDLCLAEGHIPSDGEINAMLEVLKQHEN